MHAGQIVKMKPGAVVACALPMGLGLFFTGLLLAGGNQSDLFMSLPVALCFLFGTPLSAWLACRRLRKIANPARLRRWGTVFWAGLKWSSFVHFMSALIYTIGFLVVTSSQYDQVGASGGNEAFSIFFMSGFMNAMLWCILTLPFALLCASIFWRVTKFPQDASVFQGLTRVFGRNIKLARAG